MGCASVKSAAIDGEEEVFEFGNYGDSAMTAYEDEVVLSVLLGSPQTKDSVENETIIFLDWDDALCPLMRACQNRGTSMAKARRECGEELNQLSRQVVELLTVAQKCGKVVIVTNESRIQFNQSCFQLTTKARAMLKKIPVIYAREHQKEGDTSKLPTADTQAEGNTHALKAALSDFCSHFPGQALTNIVSVGASQCALDAIRQFTKQNMHAKVASEACRTKTIKTRDGSSLSSMVLQQAVVTRWLSHIVYADVDVDIDFAAGAAAGQA